TGPAEMSVVSGPQQQQQRPHPQGGQPSQSATPTPSSVPDDSIESCLSSLCAKDGAKVSGLRQSVDKALAMLSSSADRSQSSVPAHELRSACLEPLQLALESGNRSLASAALRGIRRLVHDARFSDAMESERERDWAPMQVLDAVWATHSLPDDLQIEVMRLLLDMVCTCCWVWHGKVVNRVLELCVSVYAASRNRLKDAISSVIVPLADKASRAMSAGAGGQSESVQSQACVDAFSLSGADSAVKMAAKATLTQLLRGYIERCGGIDDNAADTADNNGAEVSASSEEWESGAMDLLTHLVDRIESAATSNRASLPILLDGLGSALARLPARVGANSVAFSELLWRRLCPCLVSLLANQRCERPGGGSGSGGGGSPTLGRGSGVSSGAPELPEGAARACYELAVRCLWLVGARAPLHTPMQALFNRMLLYPPVQMRAPALRAIRPLLQSPAGLLRLAGPKLDPDTGRPLDARSNLGLLRIVVDCIVEVSRSSDSGLRYLSVDLMHTLLTTIEQLAGCAKTDLAELADPAVIAEAFFDASAAAAAASSAAVCQDGDSSTGDASSEFAATSSACSDSGQQPQDDQAQCANDYVLLMVQLLPQLCEAASDADLDEQLQAFSSDFCTDQPDSSGGGGAGSLNADAVYFASLWTLRLAAVAQGLVRAPRITEAAFLSSVLDSGLLLCTSRAWLREIYRLVADQRILTFPAAVAKDSILLSNLAQLGAETPSSASGEWRRTREPQELWAHWLLLASWDAVVVVLGGTVERGERGAPLAVLFGTDAVLEDARQAVVRSVTGLQIAALLAGRLGLEARCGAVFSRLAAASCHCPAGTPLRLHACAALSLDLLTGRAVRVGQRAPDCWPHVLRGVTHIAALERQLVSSGQFQSMGGLLATSTSDSVADSQLAGSDIPALVARWQVGGHSLLTPAQTTKVVAALVSAADRLFDDAAQLPLVSLLAFVRALCDVSADLVSCGDSGLVSRLCQLVLSVTQSERLLAHVLCVWSIAGGHFTKACSEQRTAKTAVSSLHECTVALLRWRPERPHFNMHEAALKPVEWLLGLELCDADTQDQLVCCVCELVEAFSHELGSGWRPVFAALRHVRVDFAGSAAGSGTRPLLATCFRPFLAQILPRCWPTP
ncbi:hypothetical protein BOX15_Mlig017392g1, partial [Macrostomum lignano]